jgi:hypothetical protein
MNIRGFFVICPHDATRSWITPADHAYLPALRTLLGRCPQMIAAAQAQTFPAPPPLSQRHAGMQHRGHRKEQRREPS